jgi:hypothetical protein
VIHKDRIIAEKYDTLIKTVKFGLVDDQKHYVHHFWNTEKGKYDIYKPAPIVEWQQDKRKKYYNK